MRVELSQLHRDLSATMIYVTHDQIEAMTMAHRIVVLNKGRIEQFGTPMELYHHPATKFVATFIGQPNMNLLPAKVMGTGVEGLSVEFHSGLRMTLPVDTANAKTGDMVEVGLRPENAALGAGLPMKLPGDTALAEGQSIDVTFNPADCHVFDASGNVMRRRIAPAIAA
jgi:multiple sugar transport system ATP-binding protein